MFNTLTTEPGSVQKKDDRKPILVTLSDNTKSTTSSTKQNNRNPYITKYLHFSIYSFHFRHKHNNQATTFPMTKKKISNRPHKPETATSIQDLKNIHKRHLNPLLDKSHYLPLQSDRIPLQAGIIGYITALLKIIIE